MKSKYMVYPKVIGWCPVCELIVEGTLEVDDLQRCSVCSSEIEVDYDASLPYEDQPCMDDGE